MSKYVKSYKYVKSKFYCITIHKRQCVTNKILCKLFYFNNIIILFLKIVFNIVDV